MGDLLYKVQITITSKCIALWGEPEYFIARLVTETTFVHAIQALTAAIVFKVTGYLA